VSQHEDELVYDLVERVVHSMSYDHFCRVAREAWVSVLRVEAQQVEGRPDA